uniref:Metallothionein 3c n=1 Tax=Laccaria bicolor TaxID=29883 RepID=A0A0F6MXI7_LACBI|nr:metallothionein 3c [Laccaria bicolor]
MISNTSALANAACDHTSCGCAQDCSCASCGCKCASG